MVRGEGGVDVRVRRHVDSESSTCVVAPVPIRYDLGNLREIGETS